ncbi:hypothetical protein ACQCPP_12455 [Priestia megaterium]|uniref:hypothetical protein n=1 Tax=Priestia megaterium TaxID=1404 RepID=UPI003D039E43
MDERTVINKILNKSSGIKAIVGDVMSDLEMYPGTDKLSISEDTLAILPKGLGVLSDKDTQLILQYIKPLYETGILTDDEVHELLHSENTEYLRDTILTHAYDVYDALDCDE